MKSSLKLALGMVAAIALLYGGVMVYALFASSPEVGAGIAFGQLDGNPRIAIALCPGDEIQRISVYDSESEVPPRSSLLWEVREPGRDLPNPGIFTIGDRDGFGSEPKRLSNALPSTFQVEYESDRGGTDAVMPDRAIFFKFKDGEWSDGEDRVTLKSVKAAGC